MPNMLDAQNHARYIGGLKRKTKKKNKKKQTTTYTTTKHGLNA